MKYKKNRMKQFGEISWMLFAMSIATFSVLIDNFSQKRKCKKV